MESYSSSPHPTLSCCCWCCCCRCHHCRCYHCRCRCRSRDPLLLSSAHMLQLRHHRHHHQGGHGGGALEGLPPDLPLVVSLNCLEDTSLEAEGLSGVAMVEHVGLGRIAEGRIESAAAVIVQSLAFLPRAAQRRLQPWQLIVCLGSADRSVDTALAADLGLSMVHVDANRAEEVADTVMALFLGLLRRTHLLSRHVSSSAAASGWLGSIQPLCRGMRRCRGLVLGIVGRSASAKCLATRSLAFRMSVLYFDVQEVFPSHPSIFSKIVAVSSVLIQIF